MKKLTKQNIENLAKEIMVWLEKECLADSVSIYYNNKVLRSKTEYRIQDNTYSFAWIDKDNVDPHDYFEYAAYDHILSMSFEGGLYDLLNYEGGDRQVEFYSIFEKYGLCFEFGNNWNITVFPRKYPQNDMAIEYTHYDKPKKEIHIGYFNKEKAPEELEKIINNWYELSSKEGDNGSCVLGAGFRFDYQGNRYFMSACSPYQGSLSWEAHKDTIKKLLKDAGATIIYYNWGNID